MKNIILYCGLIACLAGIGCANNRGTQPRLNELDEQGAAWSESACFSMDTAVWSKWTPQEREMNQLLGRTMARHLKVSEGNLVLDMTQEEFLQTGLSDSLYNRLVDELKSNVRYLDSAKIGKTERTEMNEDFLKNLRKTFGDR